MSTITTKPASQAQFAFIKNLLAERDIDEAGLQVVQSFREMATRGGMASRNASALIDALQQYPRKAQPTTDEPVAGIYRKPNGELYRVYLGQQSGRMLAKHIRNLNGTVDYMYAGAASLVVRDAVRLSVEEVGSLGKEWDSCLCCGRRLDDPESVDRGIGPVCAKKYAA